MSNLENFNNIYADLAESAYGGKRPNKFPYEQFGEKEQKVLNSGKSIDFDFSQSQKVKVGEDKAKKPIYETTQGGTNLPNKGIVYLQPDPTLHTEETKLDLPSPSINGTTETYVMDRYQKGLLTDEKAGFNSYFVTDTPTLNQETKNAYLTIRGSDAMSLANLNDWLDNDLRFALTNTEIPQAELAAAAMKEKIKELSESACIKRLNFRKSA